MGCRYIEILSTAFVLQQFQTASSFFNYKTLNLSCSYFVNLNKTHLLHDLDYIKNTNNYLSNFHSEIGSTITISTNDIKNNSFGAMSKLVKINQLSPSKCRIYILINLNTTAILNLTLDTRVHMKPTTVLLLVYTQLEQYNNIMLRNMKTGSTEISYAVMHTNLRIILYLVYRKYWAFYCYHCKSSEDQFISIQSSKLSFNFIQTKYCQINKNQQRHFVHNQKYRF